MADLNIGNSSANVLVNAKHNGSVIPQINNTYDLGTSTLRWKNIHGDTFVGSLNGNAATATKLATARTISLTGSVTGSGTFDGSGNLSITTTTNHTHSYLPLSGGTLTGNLQIGNSDSSSTSAEAVGIIVRDLRAVSMAPSTLGDRTAVFYFDEAGPSGDNSWKGILRVKGWTDSYAAWELAGPGTSADTKEFYVRSGLGGGAWGSWRKLLTDDNYTSYTVTKTGSGASGTWGISVSGNAATATKATKDSANQQINTTYIKGLSISGRTITYTKGDGTTGTITTQDTNTTYGNATTSAAGLMSKDDKAKLDGITASADAVSFSRSLTSGTKVGTITINGTGTDLYAPTNTDTHWTTGITAGATGTTSNSATTNGNTFIKIKDNSTHRGQIKLVGSGATSVSSDANGVITINSTDNNTTYGSMSVSEGTTGTATTDRVLTATNLKGIINANISNIQIGGRNLLKQYIKAGGRCTKIDNLTIKVGTESSDTYFFLKPHCNLIAGETYTISCEASNVPSGCNWSFGIRNQNSNWQLYINKNGKNFATGVLDADIGADTEFILDDLNGRPSTAPNIILTNFKLEKGNKATDWTPAPEDVENYTDNVVSDAKTEITREYSSLINETASQISLTIDELSRTVNANSDSIVHINNSINVTSQDINLVKTTMSNIQNAVNGKVSADEIKEWARFDGATLELGASNQPFKARLTTTELAFYQGSNKVAWISNNEFHILTAIITQSINCGNFTFVDEGSMGFSLL